MPVPTTNTVRLHRVLRAPPERVYRALTNPDELSGHELYALSEEEYLGKLRAAGFGDVSLEVTRVYDAADARAELVTAATLELAQLAKVLDALHLRVRVADDLGEKHRREAQTAGAEHAASFWQLA